MIFKIASSFKCAILLFLLSLNLFDRLSDFLYYHLGNIADRRTEHGNDLNSVEIKDMLKILSVKICSRVISRTGKSHKRNTAFDCIRKPHFQVVAVKLLKQASIFD